MIMCESTFSTLFIKKYITNFTEFTVSDGHSGTMVKAVKKDGTVEWEKYDLAEMRKSMSIVKIACELDVSDMAVRKRMKKLGIK